MNATRFLTPALVALVISAGSHAAAQVGFFNTFTSGNPPVGDGNDYPFSLNPARQVSSGGARPDTFSSVGVAFNNLNGNPAFFDSNNLLTRPAGLINGDAFWTDPRLGSFNGPNGNRFDIAQVGFEFFDPNLRSFGFDLAIASASAEVPTSIPFQIQDVGDDEFGFGQLQLTDDFGGDFQDVLPNDSGTFASLGGRQGREARYRIDLFDLETLLSEEFGGVSGGDGRLGDQWFFDIDLSGIATLGGTTQIAIDNFVVNFETTILPGPTLEPTYLPPTPPVGENRPQYFNYAPSVTDQSDGDSFDFDPSTFGEGFTNITVIGEATTADEAGARAQTAGSSVTFESDTPGLEILGHEVIHAVQTPDDPMDGGPPFVLPPGLLPLGETPESQPTPPSLTPAVAAMRVEEPLVVGPAVRVNNLVETGPGTPPAPGDAPSLQVVEVLTLLGTGPGSETARLAAELDEGVREIEGAVTDSPRFTNLVVDETPGALLEVLADEPGFYRGFTVDQYLSLKDQAGEPLLFGDAGSYVVPVTGTSGETVTYRVATWTVADVSGLYIPVLLNNPATIPEPATGLLLVLVAGAAVSARR